MDKTLDTTNVVTSATTNFAGVAMMSVPMRDRQGVSTVWREEALEAFELEMFGEEERERAQAEEEDAEMAELKTAREA